MNFPTMMISSTGFSLACPIIIIICKTEVHSDVFSFLTQICYIAGINWEWNYSDRVIHFQKIW